MGAPRKTSHGAGTASRQLAGHLRDLIAGGTFVPGDRLPSERTLAAEHGLARNTAREAIRQLAESGLVTAEHGRGVFVRRTPRRPRPETGGEAQVPRIEQIVHNVAAREYWTTGVLAAVLVDYLVEQQTDPEQFADWLRTKATQVRAHGPDAALPDRNAGR